MNFSPQRTDIKITEQKSVYFVGIKGVGMAALAQILHQAGVRVSGADVTESFVTDVLLQNLNIHIDDIQSVALPEGIDVLVFSGAHQGKRNRLVQEAVARDVPVLSLAQATGSLTTAVDTVAVCGVGGKSTNSALLAWTLEHAGLEPSYSIGVGSIPNLGKSGNWNPQAKHFVVEADEYVADPQEDPTPRFLYIQPKHVLCTALTFDHPDMYANFEDTKRAFTTFFMSIPSDGTLVYSGDDIALRQLIQELNLSVKTVSVGWQPENDFCITDFVIKEGASSFAVGSLGNFQLSLPGKHNVWNAAASAVLASQLEVPLEKTQEAVAQFRSTKRRFELKGTTPSGVVCYDDYAHHPRELTAVIEALSLWFPQKKRVLAFQPHTFSRTKALFDDFVAALANQSLDEVWILPIFASARESFDASITSEMLVEALQNQGTRVRFVPDHQTLVQWTKDLPGETVFLTAGAGDIYTVYDAVTLSL